MVTSVDSQAVHAPRSKGNWVEERSEVGAGVQFCLLISGGVAKQSNEILFTSLSLSHPPSLSLSFNTYQSRFLNKINYDKLKCETQMAKNITMTL